MRFRNVVRIPEIGRLADAVRLLLTQQLHVMRTQLAYVESTQSDKVTLWDGTEMPKADWVEETQAQIRDCEQKLVRISETPGDGSVEPTAEETVTEKWQASQQI